MKTLDGSKIVCGFFGDKQIKTIPLMDEDGNRFELKGKDFFEMIKYFNFKIVPKTKLIHIESPVVKKSKPQVDKAKHINLLSIMEEYWLYKDDQGWTDDFKDFLCLRRQKALSYKEDQEKDYREYAYED